MTDLLILAAYTVAALFVGSLLFVAVITARESLRPRPTVAAVDMPAAVENTSSTPIYDGLSIEMFRQQLDERLEEGLRDWGRGDVA